MKETLQFLRDLSKNNNKNWFDANKDRYLAAWLKYDHFLLFLLLAIGRFHIPSIHPSQDIPVGLCI